MSTYAIGDIQGCFAELENLLDAIHFDSTQDVLWFTGDLVNRGPRSLEVLRFIKSLGDQHVAVLGNHDLHLLAVSYGVRDIHRGDTLREILDAPDRAEIFDWLRRRPLFHEDKTLGYVMAHAGLAPVWTVTDAHRLAREVETVLQGDSPEILLKNMYGNQPDYWDEKLTGIERWRAIINFFTRMRFCHADGRLDLSYKGEIIGKPDELIPWFLLPNRVNAETKIIVGHWAALGGKTDVPEVIAIDTGCVWGNCLTALRLDDGKRFSVRCG